MQELGMAIDVDTQIKELSRGCVSFHSPEELKRRLEEGRPLRVKAGFDPTAPDLHLGHTVLLQRMKRFQDLGHQAIFLIGDFTARIGDPSGRSKTRPPLTDEEIQANAKTYAKQVFKILDPETTEVRFNGEWFAGMSAADLIRLASRYPLARMLERDDFAKRHAEGVSISIHEFLYPLVQAYDSIALQADVELGGDDQLFNLLLGRTLMRQDHQAGRDLPPQVVMTNPLLEGIDAREEGGEIVGAKMSKSLGNAVGIDEAPRDIFGKLMRVCDPLMWRYYELLSDLSLDAIAAKKAAVASGTLHPRAAKADLAEELTDRYGGPGTGAKERQEFDRISHHRDAVPDDLACFEFQAPISIVDCLCQCFEKQVKSRGAARRLIDGGAVKLDGEKITSALFQVESGNYVLRAGKRNFAQIRVQ
ncbi:MAG TPA: tyrosine--tRNA ligase [Myxococcales bacterium]|nr:tyrosine--tRNA ligase [Myxococcales bacterium]